MLSGEESIAIHGGHNHRIAKRTIQPGRATIRQLISPSGHYPPAKTQHHRQWTQLSAKKTRDGRYLIDVCIRMHDSTEENEPNCDQSEREQSIHYRACAISGGECDRLNSQTVPSKEEILDITMLHGFHGAYILQQSPTNKTQTRKWRGYQDRHYDSPIFKRNQTISEDYQDSSLLYSFNNLRTSCVF